MTVRDNYQLNQGNIIYIEIKNSPGYTYLSLNCFPYLEISCSSQHRFDGPHSVIIMVLGRELFRAQPVHRHDFDGEGTGLDKTTGVERDLGNQGVVRYHHSHCSEEGLYRKKHTYRSTTKFSSFFFFVYLTFTNMIFHH